MGIRVGCQVNCWPVGPDFGAGLVTAIREAGEIGFAGVEVNWRMTRTWQGREDELRAILAEAGVVLSALFFGAGSADTTAARQEIGDADRCAAFLQRLGATRMMVGGGKATADPETFKSVCRHYSELGKRVLGDHGVMACYHLHGGAIASSPEEIEQMMALTNTKCWFLCPDTGIMAKEGHDLLAVLRRYADRIPYVHFKDWAGDNRWAMLGQGVVDHKAVLATLVETGFDGWIVSENESQTPGRSPMQLQAADRQWLRDHGF